MRGETPAIVLIDGGRESGDRLYVVDFFAPELKANKLDSLFDLRPGEAVWGLLIGFERTQKKSTLGHGPSGSLLPTNPRQREWLELASDVNI